MFCNAIESKNVIHMLTSMKSNSHVRYLKIFRNFRTRSFFSMLIISAISDDNERDNDVC